MSKMYQASKNAVQNRKLKEPFRAGDYQKACPGFAAKSYGNFLAKHRLGNPGNYTAYYKRVSVGLYKLLRPFKNPGSFKDIY